MNIPESPPVWWRQYKWHVAGYLWMVCLLNYVDRSCIFALYPLLEKEFSLSGTQLGLIGSVFLWVYSAASPLTGALGDRWPRRNVILASLAIWSVITCLTGLARTTGELLAFRALMGIAEAAYFPAALALLSDYHTTETRSKAISFHQSGLYAGNLLGGVLAGMLAERLGWRVPFYVFGAVGIVALLVFSPLIREPERGGADRLAPAGRTGGRRRIGLIETAKTIATTPTTLVLALVHFAVFTVAWIMIAWTPFYLHTRFGIPLGAAAIQATAALQIPAMLGILAGGVLADSLMRRTIHGRMATLIAGLILGAPFLVLTGWGGGLTATLIGLAGLGFFKAFFDGNSPPAIYDVVHPEIRSTAYGLYVSLSGIASGFGVLAVGVLKDRLGLGNLLGSLWVIYVASAVLLWYASARHLRADRGKLALDGE